MKKEVVNLIIVVLFFLININFVLAIPTQISEETIKGVGTANRIILVPPQPLGSPTVPDFSFPKRDVQGVSTAAECGSIPTNGCTITQNTTFNPGTYIFNDSISIIANNVTLDCNGATIKGITGSTWPPPNNTDFSGIEIGNNYNIIIKNCNMKNWVYEIADNFYYNRDAGPHPPGFMFGVKLLNNNLTDSWVGLYPSPYSKNDVIKGNNFIRNYNHCIYDFQAPNSTIEGNLFKDSALGHECMIFLGGCDQKYINNTADNVSYPIYNIAITNSTYYYKCSYVANISSNVFKNTPEGPALRVSHRAIVNNQILPNGTVTIEKNEFSNNRAGAIDIQGTGFTASDNRTRNTDVKILKNKFYGNEFYAVRISPHAFSSEIFPSKNIEIYENECVGYAISPFDHCIVVNAWPLGNAKPYPISDVSIHDNNLTNFGGGVFVLNNHYGKNNRIFNNNISGGMIGIPVYAANGTLVSANKIYNNYVGMQSLYLDNDVNIFLNDIYSNSQKNIESDFPLEVSYAKFGNYWGHSTPPCFIPGFDSNSISVVDSFAYCYPTNLTSILIPIPSFGWYFFSFNVLPANTTPQNILNPLTSVLGAPFYDVVQALLNGNSDQYVPGGAFNDLNNMNPLQGYWVKLITTPDYDLVVAGNKITSCNSLNLNLGTHWIGYWPSNPEATSGALSSVAGNYDYIRTFENGAWKTYDPDLIPFSDLTEMKPGNGYLIRMLNSDTLDYCL